MFKLLDKWLYNLSKPKSHNLRVKLRKINTHNCVPSLKVDEVVINIADNKLYYRTDVVTKNIDLPKDLCDLLDRGFLFVTDRKVSKCI